MEENYFEAIAGFFLQVDFCLYMIVLTTSQASLERR